MEFTRTRRHKRVACAWVCGGVCELENGHGHTITTIIRDWRPARRGGQVKCVCALRRAVGLVDVCANEVSGVWRKAGERANEFAGMDN